VVRPNKETSADPDHAGRLATAANHTMLIVTAHADGRPDGDRDGGCLVGFHAQASIKPWRHCVFLSVANHTHRVASTSRHLAVHVLPSATGGPLARLFGSMTEDDGIDKFQRCSWQRSPFGPAVLDDAAGWFVGEIVGRLQAGDHEAFVLEPVDSWMTSPVPPLLRFDDVRHLEPGHAAD
jgi:flavin reductase (DIM6/NTAB) family NADH-FMN oxidoreductase RutF